MNDPRIMEGPADLWHFAGVEWRDGALSKPLFVRSAYRRVMRSDQFEALKDKIADRLDDFHWFDFYPVRVLYRAARSINDTLFGTGKQREMEWVCGVAAAACVVAIAFRILAHR